MMRKVAIFGGFIEKDCKYNVLGGHTLMESFSSILTNIAVPETMTDFISGHLINEITISV